MTTVTIKQANDIDATNAYRVEVTEDFSDTPNAYVIHTNSSGKGLWIDGRQIEGTSQFDLNVKNKAAKIRRYFTERSW